MSPLSVAQVPIMKVGGIGYYHFLCWNSSTQMWVKLTHTAILYGNYVMWEDLRLKT